MAITDAKGPADLPAEVVVSDQPHLILVDGSGYIFRAYHRLPPLTNKHGEPVGAVYGYTAMLWKLTEALHKADGPTHMAVILDKSSKSRQQVYLTEEDTLIRFTGYKTLVGNQIIYSIVCCLTLGIVYLYIAERA